LAGGYRTRPTPLGDTLREVLDRAGLGGIATSSTLCGRWAELVGPGIAAHSSPGAIKGGRLAVTVDSSAWMNQLSLLSTDLIEKVNAGLGAGTVTELRFRIGKPSLPGARRKPAAKDAPKKRSLTPSERAEVEQAASKVADPELRKSVIRLLTAAASVRKKA
jgi:predicted nucleic acid-binding Zn ribbon protein